MIWISSFFSDHLHRKSGSVSSSGVLCYTCMSRSMSPLSRAIFMRTLQIPAEAESDLCDDPFNLHLPTSNFSSESTGEINESLWGMGNSSAIKRKLASFVQPCESSCLKAVLESKRSFYLQQQSFKTFSDKKIYLRGCLTSMYKQISARDYHFTMVRKSCCKNEIRSYKKMFSWFLAPNRQLWWTTRLFTTHGRQCNTDMLMFFKFL